MSLLAGFPLWKENRAERFWGNPWNPLVSVGLNMLLGVVTLWPFGFPALVRPVLLAANLNQRLFRYNALAKHASRAEFQQILERSGGKLNLLDALLGLTQIVPIVNLLSPIYIGLSFTHFCLNELQDLRNRQDRLSERLLRCRL